MGFHFLNMNILEGGLNVFELSDTEFDSNVSSLKNFFQLVDIMTNKKSFSHGSSFLTRIEREINIQFDKFTYER